MLSKEKEDLVRKLLSEKRSSREIRKIKSTTSQALDLFQKGDP